MRTSDIKFLGNLLLLALCILTILALNSCRATRYAQPTGGTQAKDIHMGDEPMAAYKANFY